MFLTLPNAIFFYFLFNDFYRKSYKTTDNAKVTDTHSVEEVPTKNKPADLITPKCTEFADDAVNNNSIAKLNINNSIISEKKAN